MKSALLLLAICLGCATHNSHLITTDPLDNIIAVGNAHPADLNPTNLVDYRPRYPLATRIAERDGTNYIGVYLGMIAEHDTQGGVMMYSATSGELLRWISYAEFKAVYVDKTKKEYEH